MPITIADLTEQFIEQGRYLRGWSPKTVRVYRQSLATFLAVHAEPLSRASLQAFVITMRNRGLTPGGINIRLRTINSFLSWLHSEGHTVERLRTKLLPSPPKPYATLTDADIRRLVAHVPRRRGELRAWTLSMLLLDTGLRLAEALSLEREQVDLEGLAIRVVGKGSRIRLVPLSAEGRKALYRWMTKSEGRHLFSTSDGRCWSQRNAHRDLTRLCRALGIRKVRVNPHAFRHCFAVSYVRNGGDIYRLSRILGHTSIATTQIYLRSMGLEHLQEGHAKFSPLGRLA